MLATIAPFLCSVLASIITVVLYRRKNEADLRKAKAEAYQLEIKNVEAILDFWQRLTGDLTSKVEDLMNEISKLRNENKTLTIEVKKLEKLLQENKLL